MSLIAAVINNKRNTEMCAHRGYIYIYIIIKSQLRVTKAEMWKQSYELPVKLLRLRVRLDPGVQRVEQAIGDTTGGTARGPATSVEPRIRTVG